MERARVLRKAVVYGVIFLLIPAVIALGVLLWKNRNYNIISIAVALLACVPFLFAFERRAPKARELIVVAVMSAISVAGRFLFFFVPGFKPVTAVTVITGIAFGPEAGFLTGAVTAIVSNIYFGQGPWTAFQMFTWGLLGFAAGLLAKTGLMKKPWFLCVYGVVSGVAFSLVMDIWTVLSAGDFSWTRYFTALFYSLNFMVIYAVSNVVFLLVLANPIGSKLERIRVKYGLMPETLPKAVPPPPPLRPEAARCWNRSRSASRARAGARRYRSVVRR